MELILYIIGMLTIAIGAGVFIIWHNYQLNKRLSFINYKIKTMATEAQVNELLTLISEQRVSITNISADITRLVERAEGGDIEGALVEFRQLAADTKAVADRTPEPEVETPEEPTPEV